MIKQSMRRKIACSLIGIGLMCVILTTTLCILVFYQGFRDQNWRSLQATAREIAIACRHIELPYGLAEFDHEAIRITLVSADGKALYDSGDIHTMNNHLFRPEIQHAISHGEGQASRRSETTGINTYYHAIRLETGDILRLGQEDHYTWDIFGRAIPVVLICAVLITAGSVVITLYLCRQLIQPILYMTKDLDLVMERVPYEELLPFAQAIHADRQLRENHEKMRQEFTANVSHELKTPLTSISGYAELLEADMVCHTNISAFAGKIRTEAQRMITLVNDILQLSRLDEMQRCVEQVPVWETVNLAELAQNCVENQKLNAQKAYITLSCMGPATSVMGDPRMLEDLLQNLCDNAIRYNQPGGRVRILTDRDSRGQPFLRVQDDGIGIPEDAKERVFERFYRVDKSRSKSTGGTGLGLAIVKHIALLHMAEISLVSEENFGTTITVTFPKTVFSS